MVLTMVVAFFHDTVVEWGRHRVVLLFSQEIKYNWYGFAKYISWHVRYNREKEKHTHRWRSKETEMEREREKEREILEAKL